MSLKYFPTTTVKTENWTNYRRNFVATLTVKSHQNFIDKIFMVFDTIGCTIKYSKYFFLSGVNLEFFYRIMQEKLKNHSIAKDGRAVFIDIDAYHQVQLSE